MINTELLALSLCGIVALVGLYGARQAGTRLEAFGWLVMAVVASVTIAMVFGLGD